MRKSISFLFVLLILFSCKNQDAANSEKPEDSGTTTRVQVFPEVYIAQLPDDLLESSGLMYYDNLLWSFNDSGGKSEIYGFNRKGEIVKKVKINHADNDDWEDIAQDGDFIYIGDFGNNNGSRKSLQIYRIRKRDLNDEPMQSVDAEKISFTYADQTKFNYSPQSTPYDCEALVEFSNSLYLFTKNWQTEKTTVYNVAKNPGEYELAPVDSFNVEGLITGADISPGKKRLAMVGYSNFQPIIRLFSGISENSFFNGDKIFMNLESLPGAQTEGICFLGNDTLLVSCERTFNFAQQVFCIDLNALE